MTTRIELANWIEKGRQDNRVIIDPFIEMIPNLRYKQGIADNFVTTKRIGVYDSRMRQIGLGIPLRTIVVNVIGLALIGRFSQAEEAWQKYWRKQFPTPRFRQPGHREYEVAANLLGITNYSARRLIAFHSGDTTVGEIINYLRKGDPLLFGDDNI